MQPDEGTIEIEGKAYDRLTPHLVEELGIHFIHQDRLLVPTFTVGEALFLGRETRACEARRSSTAAADADACGEHSRRLFRHATCRRTP